MDGTLIDSNEASEISWKAWALRKRVSMDEIRKVHHGRRPEETIALVAPQLDSVQEAKLIYDELKTIDQGVHPIAGANDFVMSLPNDVFAVVTAATKAILVHRFKLVGLSVPQVCVTSELLKRGKPDPEGYLMAAKALGLSPDDCLVFEDAPAGLLAAQRAGIRSVAVTTTYSEEALRKELGQDFQPLMMIRNYKSLDVDLTKYQRGSSFEIVFQETES